MRTTFAVEPRRALSIGISASTLKLTLPSRFHPFRGSAFLRAAPSSGVMGYFSPGLQKMRAVTVVGFLAELLGHGS
jgi:hypothetical protein